jgi:hypothetical protein
LPANIIGISFETDEIAKKHEKALKKAFDAIIKRNETISAAANIAGLSYRDFYEKLIESKILSNKDIEYKVNNNKDINKILNKLK